MYGESMVYYFIFWSIVSLIVAILAGLSLIYLFTLLRGIKRSLSSIEALLLEKGAKEKPRK